MVSPGLIKWNIYAGHGMCILNKIYVPNCGISCMPREYVVRLLATFKATRTSVGLALRRKPHKSHTLCVGSMVYVVGGDAWPLLLVYHITSTVS